MRVVCVSPCPGKCFAHAATPAPCSPRRTRRRAARRARVGAERPHADDRARRVDEHVGDRREVEVHAAAREIAAERRRHALASADVVDGAEREVPGIRAARRARSSRVTSPPSSSIATTRPSRSARSAAVSARELLGVATFRANSTTPPRPALEPAPTPSPARVEPVERREERRRGEPLERSLTLDGAGGQPERDLPLHEQEEDDHRDRDQRRAGHQPAPVRVPARAR